MSDKEIAGWEIMERTGRRPKDTPVYFYAQLSKPMDEVVSWREGPGNLTVIRKEYG